MTYFILDTELEGVVLDRPTGADVEGVELDHGKRYDGTLPLLKFHIGKKSEGQLFDLVSMTFPALLFSEKFRSALEAVGVDNVDCYPAVVVNGRTGEKRRDYFVANIVGAVPCMDWKRSRYTPSRLPNKISSIEELRLDETRLVANAAPKIFRLAERLGLVLVEEGVAKALRRAGVTGVSLVPAEGYSTLR